MKHFAAAALAAAAVSSQAQILTFDEASSVGTGARLFTDYLEDGLLVSTDGAIPYPFDLAAWGRQSPHYLGSPALFRNVPGGLVRLSRLDGRAFDFLSIDLAGVYAGGIVPFTLIFRGFDPAEGWRSTPVLVSPPPDGFAHVEVPLLRDVTRVEWRQTFPYHQFDNVTVPAAGSLALPALAGLVGLRRRV